MTKITLSSFCYRTILFISTLDIKFNSFKTNMFVMYLYIYTHRETFSFKKKEKERKSSIQVQGNFEKQGLN